MKFIVFQKPESRDLKTEQKIIECAKRYGLIYDDKDYEVVICLGGDGTFLRASQHFLDKLDKISFFGLNIGNLGYYYDYDLKDLEKAMEDLASGNFIKSSYHMLHCDIVYEDETTNRIDALNEVRIENPFHTLICKVKIGGNELETFRGTGLLVSSAVGSSAYNRSLGGSLIDPTLDLMEFTEIASIQNNAYNSLGSSTVISGKTKIEFEGDFESSVIGYDALTLVKENVRKLTFYTSDKKVNVIHKKDYSFVNKWNESFIK